MMVRGVLNLLTMAGNTEETLENAQFEIVVVRTGFSIAKLDLTTHGAESMAQHPAR